MDILQEILVFVCFLGAIFYMVKTFFFPKKTKKACGSDNCGC